MKNFIFKSDSKSDLYKILTKLDLLLSEQRQQRHDLSRITKLLKGLIGEFITSPKIDEESQGQSDDISDSE